jgi:hypothetical protein
VTWKSEILALSPQAIFDMTLGEAKGRLKNSLSRFWKTDAII